MSVRIGDETDAFEDVIPVEVLASPETVAAYGEAADATTAKETVTIPTGVVPGFGGLRRRAVVDGDGRPRRRRALSRRVSVRLRRAEGVHVAGAAAGRRPRRRVLAAGHGPAEHAAGGAADAEGAREVPVRERRLRLLAGRLLDDVAVSHRLPAARVQDRGRSRSTTSIAGVRDRAYDYLERELAAAPPDVNEGWWPAYTAWQAFAVKVLVEGGRNQDSHLTRLYGYRDRMPVFALAYLHDALLAKGETTRRPRRRSAAPHGERDPAGRRQRARRGAGRSVPAVVLELERPIDRHRAQLARQGGRDRRADAADSCAG